MGVFISIINNCLNILINLMTYLKGYVLYFFKTIVLSPPLREEQLFLICVCVLDYVCMVVHVHVCMVCMYMCVCASGG